MTSPRTLSGLPWVWFTAWLLVGAGYALSFIGIASIGLFVLPLPVLYVAYLNRAGPGTICTTVAGGQECHDEWSPWPWLAVGVILFVVGVAAFIDRQRRASHRS